MRLKFLFALVFAILSIDLCQCDEGDQAPHTFNESQRHEQIVFQNKEETVFEVKSTTARKSSRPSVTTTTSRPSSAGPTHPTTSVPSFSTRFPIRNKNKRTTTVTTHATTPATIISPTPAIINDNNNTAEKSESADRLGKFNQNYLLHPKYFLS